MKKNAHAGAQLAKSLTFEVEAIPQDNAIEIKNTENMTPLTVKVRVRKKNDGPSFVRKGFIAVPRIDLPDSPIERLRLASSDHTIMSFNMLMEADLEKKVPKKSKRSFFGICLGVQEDDDVDDVQYLPSASSLEKDSRSDSGVMKLKNMRPIVKPVVANTSSSFSASKKDKIFGKCKPGGCLDPPFGEDKYAYQPQSVHHKSSAKTVDYTQELDLQDPSNKLRLNKKGVEVVESKVKDGHDGNQDKSILSLYQGEAKTADDENDSEFIITYPPALSSSGLLMADEKHEKNVVRRTSGARQSRKSFNEFSTEYFSPPRTPRESKDSHQKDKVKQTYTREILSPGQVTAKSISPTGITGSVTLPQKSILTRSSQDLTSELLNDLEREPERNTWDRTATAGLAGIGVATTGLVGLGMALGTRKDIDKSNELRTVSSQGKTLENRIIPGIETGATLSPVTLSQKSTPQTISQGELLNDEERKPDREAWDSAASAGLTGVGAATTGLVGLGTALSTRKEIDKLPIEHEEKSLQISERTATRDSNLESTGKDIHSESTGRTATGDTDANTSGGPLLLRREMIRGTQELDGTDINIPSHERATAGASLNRGVSPMEHVSHGDTERDLVFHGLELAEGSERRISQVGNTRPIHDDTYSDLVPTGGSERGLRRLTNEGVDGDLASMGMEVIGDSERGFSPMGRTINDGTDRHLISGRRTTGSEGNFPHAGRAANETIEITSKGVTMTESSEVGSHVMERRMYEGASDFLTSGSETGYPPEGSAFNKYTQEEHAPTRELTDGTERTYSPLRRAMSDGMDRDFKSKENTVVGGSDRGIPPMGIKNTIASDTGESERIQSIERTSTEGHDTSKGMNVTERPDRDFNEDNQDFLLADTETNADVKRTYPSRQITDGFEKNYHSGSGSFKTTNSDKEISQIRKNDGAERDISTRSRSSEKTEGSYKKNSSPVGVSRTSDDYSTAWPEKRDGNVASDFLNRPSDIISQYRDNKPLVKSPVVGLSVELTDDILEQAGRKLGDSGSGRNKDGEIATSVGISSYESKGGKRVSRESIFLNLAFQAYQEENQTAIKTLDSTKDQDLGNVVLVKSLLRSHDKTGISVPIDSKHVMNIAIKSAINQDRKSRIPKPISKFDSGKSDYSNSTISSKDIGNDPHAALSMVFHQELVPLESIIKSLKEDIDSLAAQQMMLTDRLGIQRIRPVYNRKCGCLKRITSMRTE